jgi:Ca2+/Na+ antiporter
MVLPSSVIGWVIMPIGIVLTLWVLLKKVKIDSYKYYVQLSFSWFLIAILFDYFFLVKLFNPVDGYYKMDVYLYYFLTFFLPLVIGWRKTKFARNLKP